MGIEGNQRRYCFSLLDAARDYMRIGVARLVSPEYQNLLSGDKGERLEHVAPHLFRGDASGVIAHITLSGKEPGEVGILMESPANFSELRKHLRRFLTVERERDRKRVYFRYYDPRTLRAFLPICTNAELDEFFGPVNAFYCQGDDPGTVLTFSRDDRGDLQTVVASFSAYCKERFRVDVSAATSLPMPAPPQETKFVKSLRRIIEWDAAHNPNVPI